MASSGQLFTCTTVFFFFFFLSLFQSPSNAFSSYPNDDDRHRASAVGFQKVNLSLYYDTLCPSCATFIVKNLARVFDKDLIPIINLRLVPWGNSFINKSNNAIVCQVRFSSPFVFFSIFSTWLLLIWIEFLKQNFAAWFWGMRTKYFRSLRHWRLAWCGKLSSIQSCLNFSSIFCFLLYLCSFCVRFFLFCLFVSSYNKNPSTSSYECIDEFYDFLHLADGHICWWILMFILVPIWSIVRTGL